MRPLFLVSILNTGVALGIIDLVVWHLLLALAICSYFRTVFTQPGYTTTGEGANSLSVSA